MKLLHVSDWHLGRLTYGEPRAVDHDAVLAEIVDIAVRERVDLVVHTGDLFDGARPAYTDMERAISTLEALALQAPVVVIAGNHDSPALFQLFDRLLRQRSRIRFVDKPRAPGQGGILDFPMKDGTRARLATLPFVHANRVVDAFEESSRWMTDYADRIRAIAGALGKGLLDGYDGGKDVLLFAAHLFVANSTYSGSERRIHITDSYGSNAEHVPPVSYAAFGHIHKPQLLPGDIGRYAGSPIALDFGEAGEQKSVVLAELSPGRPPDVKVIPLSGGRPLRRVEGTLDEIEQLAPSVGGALCLVTVRTETPTPGLSEEVRKRLPNATLLQVHESCAALKVEVLTRESAEGPEPSLTDLFQTYLSTNGTKGSSVERALSTFSELLTAATEERLPSFAEEELVQKALTETPS